VTQLIWGFHLKTISYRICAITRDKYQKEKLIKVTRVANVWQVDLKQKLDGRSIYLSYDQEVLNKFKKQKRRFKMTDQEHNQIIEEITGILNGKDI